MRTRLARDITIIIIFMSIIYYFRCFRQGVELLSERHESGHMCSSKPKSVQRASGVPVGQRRVLTRLGHALYDEPLSAR